MPALSFRQKILVLLIACLCLTQVLTMIVSLVTTENTVRNEIDRELAAAESVFDKLYEQRYLQLTRSVQVLAGDYGMRDAIGSRDAPTIRSALSNHAERAAATLALFIREDSGGIVSTRDISDWLGTPGWDQILSRIKTENYVFSSITLDSRQYQVVAVPVEAPLRIGWVMMGFEINDRLARDFKDMSGLDISIFDADIQHDNIVSTLDENDEEQLIAKVHDTGFQQVAAGSYEMSLQGETFLTRTHTLINSAPPIYAILQKSVQVEMQPYYRMRSRMLLLFGLVLLAAVVGSFAVGGTIIAPVRKLAEVAERIGQGNYDIEVKVDNDDEIGSLGRTLNTMQREIAQREQRIIYQSQHDELTGLPNRYLVGDRIGSAIHRARRHQRRMTIVMFDIARFKQINDTLGHHMGDVVLQETAERLKKRQRKSDTVARLGGDDFLLVLEETELETGVELIRNEISPLLSSPIHIDEIELQLKYSFGIVEYPTHGEDAVTLQRRAEIALYEAKQQPDKLQVYQSGRDESHLRELAIVSDLEHAMARNQLELYYQPKLDLKNGDLRHAEALIRWNHPEFGFLPPDEFIGVLEQTGNMGKLSNWVIATAARQCRQWRERGLDIRISINLSALDLADPALEAVISASLSEHQIPPSSLVLEITESAFMDNPATARSMLGRLRQLGLRIAIDDFGTGYSSLTQLKSLPLDELKIDKSFVQKLSPDSPDSVIVKSTIDLAHTLQLEVVAEGVETEAALELLKRYGCDKAQGYFFSRPLPAARFEQWQTEQRHRYGGTDSETT